MLNSMKYEDWGFKFIGKTIDNCIRDIKGQATLQSYPEFHDRRNYVEDLMFNLIGQTPYLFYVRRIEQGHNLGEQKWELTLATDLDNLQLLTQFEEYRATLKLIAIVVNNDEDGGLRIISSRLRSKREGIKDSFAQCSNLPLSSNYQYSIGVSPQARKLMASMP